MTIDKIPFGIENMTRRNNKLNLVNIDFSINVFKNIQKKNILPLSSIAQDFFHFVKSFSNRHNLKDKVSIWMLEDPIQKLETFTFGPIQLFCFEN